MTTLADVVEACANATKERTTDPITDPEILVDKLTKIVSHLDSTRLARLVGDHGSAESAIDCAKNLALELLGLKEAT